MKFGDISILNAFAEILHEEPKEYLSLLEHELAKGVSYPKARERAILMYLNDIRKYANVLSNPNNILGIEYLKALKRIKSNIKPLTLKRDSVEHNSTNIVNNMGSSTAVRKLIAKPNILRTVVPEATYSILEDKIKHGQVVRSITCFEKEIIYKLRSMTVADIANLPDVSEGLENVIKSAASSCNTISELISIIKSKRYTQTRIQRILLYALLGITKLDMENSQKIVPYIRVLGFNNNGKKILSEIANARLNIVTSPKKFLDSTGNKVFKNMLLQDIYATDIYTLAYDYNSTTGLDYTNPMISL